MYTLLLLICSGICLTGGIDDKLALKNGTTSNNVSEINERSIQRKTRMIPVSQKEFSMMQDMARVVIYYKGKFQPLEKSIVNRVLNTPIEMLSLWPVYKFCKANSKGINIQNNKKVVTNKSYRSNSRFIKSIISDIRLRERNIAFLKNNKEFHLGNAARVKKSIGVENNSFKSKKNSNMHKECAIFSVAIDRFKGRQQVWLVDSSWRDTTTVKKLQNIQIITHVESELVQKTQSNITPSSSDSTITPSALTHISNTKPLLYVSTNSLKFTSTEYNEDDAMDYGEEDDGKIEVKSMTSTKKPLTKKINLNNANNNNNNRVNITEGESIDNNNTNLRNNTTSNDTFTRKYNIHLNHSTLKNTNYTFQHEGINNTIGLVNATTTRSVEEKQELQKTYIGQLLNCVSKLVSKISNP